MPILPSHVGGSGPRDESEYESSADTVRLRQLCEVLLTSRAKMLGLSQSFAHRLSSLPSDLKSSLVNGLGEIIVHLDSFHIELGDTRLTGKVRLGADAGMEGHFASASEGLSRRHEARGPRHEGGFGSGLEPQASGLRPSASHPALPAPGATAVRRRRKMHDDLVQERREARARGPDPEPEVRGPGSPTTSESGGVAGPKAEVLRSEGPYGQLYGHCRERYRQGRSSVELSPEEHEELCFVCVSVFEGVTPERPGGSYEARDAAVGVLERARYVRRRAGKWHPTPSGFEASGLLGAGRWELDP